MEDTGTGVSRRKVLGATGGAVLAGATGAAAASGASAWNFGVDSEDARAAIKGEAKGVRHDLTSIGVVSARMSEQAAKQFADRNDVRYVEADGAVHAYHHRDGHDGGPGGGDDGGSTSQTLPWGIDRTDADVATANGDTGSGADVAILDTGIDSDHPDLQANLGTGKAFVSCKGGSCNTDWDDDNDHGTHCAGIADADDNSEGVVGVSTEATLHAVKVLDKRGSGSFSDVAAGLEYVADQGWDVASMSLGASSGSTALKDAVQYAASEGVTMVGAAGNDGPCTDCVGYPAAYAEVIAVSSTNCSDGLSSFSSTGPEVEIAAPGTDIYSTIPGSYDTFSGTSMATPHVAGAAGQLAANGDSRSQIEDTLKSSAEDLGLGDNEQGAGLLDVAAALGHDSSDDGFGDGPNC